MSPPDRSDTAPTSVLTPLDEVIDEPMAPVNGSDGERDDDAATEHVPADLDPEESVGESDATVRGRRALSFVVVAACCIYVLFIVHGATLVLRDSTPTGGDMGAHVWGPAYLRDHLLPQFRLSGWSQDWYAGFPAYSFYMVLPSLLIVALDVGVIPVDTWWGQGLALLLGAIAVAGIVIAWPRMSRWARALSVVAAPLAMLLIIDVPYNVAFKLAVILGLVAFPAGVWYLLSGLSLRQPGPELGAIASVAFLMDRSLFHIYGGNIASTMAGEFAFSLSITLALFALGTIARGLATGRHRVLSAVLIAATALCHVIPAIFLLFAALCMWALRPGKDARRWALPVGGVGILLATFWYVPFVLKSNFLNDMGWEKIGAIQCDGKVGWSWNDIWRSLFPFAPHSYINCDFAGATPQQFGDPNMLHGKVFFVLAAIGVLLSIVMMVRAGIWLTMVMVVSAIGFVIMPQHRFWNARILPFYYLSIYLLAAVGVYLLVRAVVLVVAGKWLHPGLWASAGVLGTAALVMLIALNLTIGALPGIQRIEGVDGQPARWSWLGLESTYEGVGGGWARWNFEGLELKPGSTADPVTGARIEDQPENTKDSREFFAMIDTMKQVGQDEGCGRAFWEYDGDLNRYGTPMAPMLLPYFTDGCIGSMEGLYFEASSTTPFHFMVQSELSQAPSRPQRFEKVGVMPADAPEGFNGSWPYRNFDLDQGIKHLQILGVKYFMTFKPETATAASGDDRLTELASSGPWKVFEVDGVGLVEPLKNLPNRWTDVDDNIHAWARPAVEWFDDSNRWDVLSSSSGPDNWPAVSWKDDPVVRKAPASDLKVSNVRQTEDTLTFDVSEVGSPVLVKTSYFPNWDVEGAEGPFRVTPNQMVVVPTSTTVTMSYGRTWTEVLGWFLTLLGVAGLVALLRWRRPPLDGPPSEFFGDRLEPLGPTDPDGDDSDTEHADADDGSQQLEIPFGAAAQGSEGVAVTPQ